jgi:multifunctional beta-oxidation protein
LSCKSRLGSLLFGPPPSLITSSEGAEDFQAIPTWGVIPQFNAELPYSFDALVPNFSPMMLLHGEQYLEVRKYPVPTSGTLVSRAKVLEVVDKGSAAIVKTGVTTTHKGTGQDVFYNEVTVFLRGCGGEQAAGEGAGLCGGGEDDGGAGGDLSVEW